MLKKLMALLLARVTLAAFAAVDVNKATPAELDGIKGMAAAPAARGASSWAWRYTRM